MWFTRQHYFEYPCLIKDKKVYPNRVDDKWQLMVHQSSEVLKTSRQIEQKHRLIIVQSNKRSRLLIVSNRRIRRKPLHVTFSYHFQYYYNIRNDTCIFKHKIVENAKSFITKSASNKLITSLSTEKQLNFATKLQLQQ